MEEYCAKKIPNFAWPSPYRAAVAIGWHVDGMAGPIASDPRNKEHLTALSLGQYGVSAAMPRILELQKKWEIPASFYIPAFVAENDPDMVHSCLQDGHEVAYHGYMHENVFLLSEQEEAEIMDLQISRMEKLCGKKLCGWSAPGWGVRKSTLDLLISRGVLYDCSLMEYDIPYEMVCGNKRLMELPISIVLDDYEIFNASLFPAGSGLTVPAEDAYAIYKEEFDGLREYGGLFSTTFHPCILGRPGRLMMLDRLYRYMKSFDDVWFARYEDIANYVLSLRER